MTDYKTNPFDQSMEFGTTAATTKIPCYGSSKLSASASLLQCIRESEQALLELSEQKIALAKEIGAVLDVLPDNLSDSEYDAKEAALHVRVVPISRKIDRLQKRLLEDKATLKALEPCKLAAREVDDFENAEQVAKSPRGFWLSKEHWSSLHKALACYLGDECGMIPVLDLTTGEIDWGRVPIEPSIGAPKLCFEQIDASESTTVEVVTKTMDQSLLDQMGWRYMRQSLREVGLDEEFKCRIEASENQGICAGQIYPD
ncbi:hypothetical protein BGZ73_008730 [Actinomortierella ambigua]|nr:hypothetical protein BGZ73_008730 [Actinomortierella ambigua]